MTVERSPRNQTTTLPRPRAPEAPPIGEPKPKRVKEEGKTGRRAKLAVASAAVLGILALGGKIAYEISTSSQQAVHRTIPGLGNGEVPSAVNIGDVDTDQGSYVFDINNVDKGTIGPNNIARLPQEEIDTQFPTAFGKLDDGKNTLQLQFPLDISSSSNPDASLEYAKSFSGTSYSERMRHEDEGIKDTFIFQNVPGGSIIKAPVDGFIRDATDNQLIRPPNGSDSQGALIDFVAPDGKKFRIFVFGLTNQTNYVFKKLVDMPKANSGDNKKAIGTFGTPVRKGQQIFELIPPQDSNLIEEVGFRIVVAREGEIGEAIDMSKPSIPTDIELLVTPDGKLIFPK